MFDKADSIKGLNERVEKKASLSLYLADPLVPIDTNHLELAQGAI